MIFDLETVINLYEGRLEQQNDLVRDLRILTENQFVTKNIHDEFALQTGERDLLSASLKFLKKFKGDDEKEDIKFKISGKDLVSVINRNVASLRENE